MNGENKLQENVGKKSNRDMSESVKTLVRGTKAEKLAKFKAGSRLETEPPTPSELLHSQGEQYSLV